MDRFVASSLVTMTLVIRYSDQSTKIQKWDPDFLADTDRLVFDPNHMEEPERSRFLKTHRDWRRNPCLARYRANGHAAEFICERGIHDGARNRKWANRRGKPVALELELLLPSGAVAIFGFDEAWLGGTSVLEIRPLVNAAPAGCEVWRVKDGSATRCIDGSSVPSRTAQSREDYGAYPCGYPSFLLPTIA